jgi:hypothetical protein
VDRAEEHFGARRAAPYLRKFYPWYLDTLGEPKRAREPFHRADDLGEARRLVRALAQPRPEHASVVASDAAPALAYS